MSEPIRVMIADDHHIVREGLQATLRSSPQVQIVGVATTFAEVREQLASIPTDVLVLDLGGMGDAPLTLVSYVLRAYPHVAIVVFSSSVNLAPELVQAGVAGYVVKEDLLDHLVTAIHTAAAGKHYLSPAVAEYVMKATNQRMHHHLTPRELTVIALVAQGLNTLEIAQQLGIEPRGVQNHVSNCLQKTGCRQRLELVPWYLQRYGRSSE
jgi:two-component system, NarL family, invasion response regulator UvrY